MTNVARMQHKIMICKFNQNVNIMRNDLFTQVLDLSYVQIIKVPGEWRGLKTTTRKNNVAIQLLSNGVSRIQHTR